MSDNARQFVTKLLIYKQLQLNTPLKNIPLDRSESFLERRWSKT